MRVLGLWEIHFMDPQFAFFDNPLGGFLKSCPNLQSGEGCNIVELGDVIPPLRGAKGGVRGCKNVRNTPPLPPPQGGNLPLASSLFQQPWAKAASAGMAKKAAFQPPWIAL